ncbi:nicotinamide riboside transporter PnuC [Pelomonas sp. CA6]|uniref:nicotinamide riboside transporter PnuC n=1 Tax=Pelomonas sp. CA6 TaxID=2907999 RepID=UPI001F4BFA18|nr:nicotinamide riboside transporter PnuC [Pelomonas sp. CA6]MCH7344917.1 nicotinamide riboside transporter PnuC [Pelomonas sp. CA6]
MDTLLQLLRPALAPAFHALGSPISWLELIAFVLALWMVVCNMRVQVLAWPLALISSLLYFLLFLDGKLYGEASLQLLFAALALWGWWQWLRGRTSDGEPLRVRRLSARGRVAALLLTLAAWPLLGLFLQQRTDSPLPYWDALPTVASLTGQWLLGRKYQENWPVWVGVNCVSVLLFAIKGYWLTVLLYALFVPLSVAGWRAWQRQLAAPA